MALAVKKDISLDPIQVGLFGADEVMPFPEDVPALIQELHLLSSPAIFNTQYGFHLTDNLSYVNVLCNR
jgi:hypothetical protein